MAMSARAFTVVRALALLLLLSGSAASLETVALLSSIVPFGVEALTLTVSVIVALLPLAMLPSVHIRGCNGLPGIPPLQVPCDATALTTLIEAGNVSFTTTLAATEGPTFPTPIV